MSPPRRARSGFTLIELLVVIAIISTLMALLLAAVQRVREAAARTQCTNNLKQIGLALHNYHDTQKMFPPGYVATVDKAGNEQGPGWGWAAHLLPYLEQGNLHATIRFDLPIEDPANEKARTTVLGGYLCPSDALYREIWGPVRKKSSGTGTGIAMANTEFARLDMIFPPGSGGEGVDSNGNVTGVLTEVCKVAQGNYVGVYGSTEPGGPGDGMFFRNSQLGFKDVADGTSQTVMVGERSQFLCEATWVGAVAGTMYYPPDWSPAPKINNPPASMVLGHTADGTGPGSPDSYANQFWSQHGRGAQFLFVDGHVSFLLAAMDYRTYRALSTRAGSDRVTGDY